MVRPAENDQIMFVPRYTNEAVWPSTVSEKDYANGNRRRGPHCSGKSIIIALPAASRRSLPERALSAWPT